MRSIIFIVSTCLVGVALAPVPERKIDFLDLQPQANLKLKETLGGDNNSLAEVPTGEQTFADMKFKIDDSLIQLVSMVVSDKPEKAEGIKVGKAFKTLYIVHACQRGAKDDAIIGYYTIHYEDKSEETIPIVYGKDVADWWFGEDSKAPTRAKVAWKGDNDAAKASSNKIRLYMSTWKNPEPTKKVISIDFGSTNYTDAAPFCVAMTIEG